MPALTITLQVLCLIGLVLSNPGPGRVPKVYNALITSNQNLEPSKAFPVYQPVLQEAAFGFPFQPAVFYGSEYPNVFAPPSGIPQGTLQPSGPAPPKENIPNSLESDISTPKLAEDVPSSTPQAGEENNLTPKPPLPPSTQAPIPLNEFGLPPAVLPLGRFDPVHGSFAQISPFYSFPGYRFFDPYDAYNLNAYANLPPVYRAFPNFPGVGSQIPLGAPSAPIPASSGTQPEQSTVPSEPSTLNVLNYSSKDSAIPNVPPPPLPQGGLKSDDKSE